MKKTFLPSFFLLIPYFMIAQTATITPAGEYYLRGVMETGSGFNLQKDSTFQFFFSYGALDRYGSGTWSSKGNKVTLNSKNKHPRDFALLRSEHRPGDSITIKIIDVNTNLLRYVYAMIESGEAKQQGAAENDGEIRFTSQKVDSVLLAFEFCPEKQSTFVIPANNHNYFEFRIEPWIMEVYFENFQLDITGDGLAGNHPLLEPGKTYSYEKAH